MNIYEVKANYERLKDKLVKALGSHRYFIEDGEVVEIDNALDLFMDLIIIRDATEEEIKLDEECEKARAIYKEFKYR